MEKLRVLFTGYAELPPTCFVFCGNFCSLPSGAKQTKLLKGLLFMFCAFMNFGFLLVVFTEATDLCTAF